MDNQNIWLLGFVLLLSGCVTTTPEQQMVLTSMEVPPQDLRDSGSHFLWQVKDEDSDVWILGSIHMARDELYPLATVIEEAFESSDELVVEINLSDDSTIQSVTEVMLKQGVYPLGDHLGLHISPELQNRVDSLSLVWGLDTVWVHRQKPWMIAMQLANLAIERSGVRSENGIDLHFMHLAEARNIPIRSLETAAEQLQTMQSMSDSLGEAFLAWTLEDALHVSEMLDTMFAAWSRGDTQALYDLVLAEDSSQQIDMTPVKTGLYDDRNQRMMIQIERYLQENRRAFVVVGSAHLVGEEGIPALLKQRGFHVQQH